MPSYQDSIEEPFLIDWLPVFVMSRKPMRTGFQEGGSDLVKSGPSSLLALCDVLLNVLKKWRGIGRGKRQL